MTQQPKYEYEVIAADGRMIGRFPGNDAGAVDCVTVEIANAHHRPTTFLTARTFVMSLGRLGVNPLTQESP